MAYLRSNSKPGPKLKRSSRADGNGKDGGWQPGFAVLARGLLWADRDGRHTADLKFLGSVDTSAATTKLVDDPAGRDWIYELEVSAEDYEEIVGDAAQQHRCSRREHGEGRLCGRVGSGAPKLDIDGG